MAVISRAIERPPATVFSYQQYHGGIQPRQRMLTATLRMLERDGLISRHVTPSIPPPGGYKLTALGTSLLAPLDQLSIWAAAHKAEIDATRAAYETQSSP